MSHPGYGFNGFATVLKKVALRKISFRRFSSRRITSNSFIERDEHRSGWGH